VEGPGDWAPPLVPATVTLVERWNGAAFEATEPPASPLGGYDLPGCGIYRITATAGAGPVPEDAAEAFRRLAEYLAADPGLPGAAGHNFNIGGENVSEFTVSLALA
jgi:hypothetical protein